MLSKKMQKALNKQLNAELYSAYLYLSMAAYFLSINLSGFAHWMHMQTREELGHAMKFYHHIDGLEGRIVLCAIEKPPPEWDSPQAVFEHACRHEQKVSAMIGKLVNLAVKEKDQLSNNFLQWFVSEQVEEEASVNQVLHSLKVRGDTASGLLTIDSELAQRKPPAAIE